MPGVTVQVHLPQLVHGSCSDYGMDRYALYERSLGASTAQPWPVGSFIHSRGWDCRMRPTPDEKLTQTYSLAHIIMQWFGNCDTCLNAYKQVIAWQQEITHTLSHSKSCLTLNLGLFKPKNGSYPPQCRHWHDWGHATYHWRRDWADTWKPHEFSEHRDTWYPNTQKTFEIWLAGVVAAALFKNWFEFLFMSYIITSLQDAVALTNHWAGKTAVRYPFYQSQCLHRGLHGHAGLAGLAVPSPNFRSSSCRNGGTLLLRPKAEFNSKIPSLRPPKELLKSVNWNCPTHPFGTFCQLCWSPAFRLPTIPPPSENLPFVPLFIGYLARRH